MNKIKHKQNLSSLRSGWAKEAGLKPSTLPAVDMALGEAQHVLVLYMGVALPQGTPSRNSCELDPVFPTSRLREERSKSQTSGLFS